MNKSANTPSGAFMGRLRAPEPKPPWRLPAALGFLAVYVVAWIAAISVISILTGEIDRIVPSSQTLALSGVVGAAVIVLSVIQFARARSPQPLVFLNLDRPAERNTMLGIFFFSLGLAWAIDLLGVVLRLKGGQSIPPLLDSLQAGQAPPWLLAAFLAVIAHPIADGLVFGGIVYPSLAQRTGDNRIAIFAGAILYMLVYIVLAGGPGQWFAAIQPMLMGVVMLCFRAYYQSARAAVIARAAFGVFFVLAAAFSTGFVGR